MERTAPLSLCIFFNEYIHEILYFHSYLNSTYVRLFLYLCPTQPHHAKICVPCRAQRPWGPPWGAAQELRQVNVAQTHRAAAPGALRGRVLGRFDVASHLGVRRRGIPWDTPIAGWFSWEFLQKLDEI